MADSGNALLKHCSTNNLLVEVAARKRKYVSAQDKHSRFPGVSDSTLLTAFEANRTVLEEIIVEQGQSLAEADDREEFFSISDAAIKESASGVVALFHIDKLNNHGNGTFSPKNSFTTVEFNQRPTPLCDTERFFGQPKGAFLSGVLVAEDVVATVNHHLPANDSSIDEVLFVFDFRLTSPQAQPLITKDNFFRGKCVIKRGGNDKVDFALIKLDRKAPANRVRKLRAAGLPLEGRSAYVLGHPCSLPLKMGGVAAVRDVNQAVFFRANFDTFNGNSGSPVFDLESHELIGIVASDNAEDFDFDVERQCCKSNIVLASPDSGDFCTKASLFADFISLDCPV